MTAQLIEISGQKMVILTQQEYERLSAAAESWSDLEATVSARKRREAGEEYVPAEVVDRILAGESALKVWRKYRSLSQEALGEIVGCQGSMISKLESGRASGDIHLWRSLAVALDVDLDDIAPDG